MKGESVGADETTAKDFVMMHKIIVVEDYMLEQIFNIDMLYT